MNGFQPSPQVSASPRRRSFRRRSDRRASAAVECAFCIPVVLLIMFGTLETCAGLYLKETLTVAAFEGVRVGVRRRATADDVIARANEVLDERGVVGATVEVSPSNFNSLDALDPITVTISAPTRGTHCTYLISWLTKPLQPVARWSASLTTSDRNP